MPFVAIGDLRKRPYGRCPKALAIKALNPARAVVAVDDTGPAARRIGNDVIHILREKPVVLRVGAHSFSRKPDRPSLACCKPEIAARIFDKPVDALFRRMLR